MEYLNIGFFDYVKRMAQTLCLFLQSNITKLHEK